MLTARNALWNATRLVESVIAPKSMQVVSLCVMAKKNRPVMDRSQRSLCDRLRAKLSVFIENRSALDLVAKCDRSLTFEIESRSCGAFVGSESGGVGKRPRDDMTNS